MQNAYYIKNSYILFLAISQPNNYAQLKEYLRIAHEDLEAMTKEVDKQIKEESGITLRDFNSAKNRQIQSLNTLKHYVSNHYTTFIFNEDALVFDYEGYLQQKYNKKITICWLFSLLIGIVLMLMILISFLNNWLLK